MKVAIIGAGAAGFFSAINLKRLNNSVEVTIFEGATKVLSKVAVSGGGRCNLTNSFKEINKLSVAYPRGDKLMKRMFKTFDYKDTFEWFEEAGVRLVTQDDNCVFPVSQDSQEIIDLFVKLSQQYNISTKISHKVSSIVENNERYELSFMDDLKDNQFFDAVVVTVGGKPSISGFEMFKSLSLDIIEPVPSLFSFNIDDKSFTELMGVVVDNVFVKLQGSKLKSEGPLLITHWGMSGPAVLKLSSYYARQLKDSDYRAKLSVNWVCEQKE